MALVYSVSDGPAVLPCREGLCLCICVVLVMSEMEELSMPVSIAMASGVHVVAIGKAGVS